MADGGYNDGDFGGWDTTTAEDQGNLPGQDSE